MALANHEFPSLTTESPTSFHVDDAAAYGAVLSIPEVTHDRLRAGPTSRSGLVPVRPELIAGVRYFGRYRSGAIRDGVLLSVG